MSVDTGNVDVTAFLTKAQNDTTDNVDTDDLSEKAQDARLTQQDEAWSEYLGGAASGAEKATNRAAEYADTVRDRIYINSFKLEIELHQRWGSLVRKSSKPGAIVELWETHATSWVPPVKEDRYSFNRKRSSANYFKVWGVEFARCSEADVHVFERIKEISRNSGVPANRVLASFITHALS